MMTDYEKQCFEAYIRLMTTRRVANKTYYKKTCTNPQTIVRRNERNKTYYQRNREKILAQQKEYRQRKKETH